MSNQIDFHQLENGITLIGERIDHVHSVSFQFLLPAGVCILPTGCCGAATVIADWLFRGAGSLDSRALIEALDGLGIHRSASAGIHHLSLNASLEAGHLSSAMKLFADIILKPQLLSGQFELSRQLAIGELQGLDDDPRQKVMILLSEQFYPDPFGRPAVGKAEELETLSKEATDAIIRKMADPSQIIFSVCGQYDFDAICKQMESLFKIETIAGTKQPKVSKKEPSNSHYAAEGAQVHIGLMTPVPVASSEWYYEILAATSILSGSMSSRLFTEVREKRGLCYAVGAKYKSLKDYAGLACYAGTIPDKAQQTLDVIRDQLDSLKNGISEDELQRAKVGLKTSLIMQGESTSARSSAIGRDYFLLGHIRELEEIRERIESLRVSDVLDYLNQYPFLDYTVTTIGPKGVSV